jgi:pseudaminic acid synthase
MKILDREIGPGRRPYLIAEMPGNHNQSLERALEIVDVAADHGTDAIQPQTYAADTMTLDVRSPGFVIDDPKRPWAGRQLDELYQEAHTPWPWHRPIMQRAALHGMHCFSTLFDASSVDFLELLGVTAYKIASFEDSDLPLIKRGAASGKPLVISTGMATVAEIGEAVQTAQQAGCKDLVLLKCTSTYPATAENTHVSTVPLMRSLFACEVGLSDDTMGCGASVAATPLETTVIQKHFTLRRADGGVDSAFSMEPHELHQLLEEIERTVPALGEDRDGSTAAEMKSLALRRSLHVAKDMKAGDVLSPDNQRCVRPGLSLPPTHLDALIGLRFAQDVPAGTPMAWSLLRSDPQIDGALAGMNA